MDVHGGCSVQQAERGVLRSGSTPSQPCHKLLVYIWKERSVASGNVAILLCWCVCRFSCVSVSVVWTSLSVVRTLTALVIYKQALLPSEAFFFIDSIIYVLIYGPALCCRRRLIPHIRWSLQSSALVGKGRIVPGRSLNNVLSSFQRELALRF